MSVQSVLGAIISLILSIPFSVLAFVRADKGPPDLAGIVVAPGYALANVIDRHFPVLNGGMLAGLGRFMVISLGINCLLYAILLYPTIRIFVVPRVMKMCPPYLGNAFWMKKARF